MRRRSCNSQNICDCKTESVSPASPSLRTWRGSCCLGSSCVASSVHPGTFPGSPLYSYVPPGISSEQPARGLTGRAQTLNQCNELKSPGEKRVCAVKTANGLTHFTKKIFTPVMGIILKLLYCTTVHTTEIFKQCFFKETSKFVTFTNQTVTD